MKTVYDKKTGFAVRLNAVDAIERVEVGLATYGKDEPVITKLVEFPINAVEKKVKKKK